MPLIRIPISAALMLILAASLRAETPSFYINDGLPGVVRRLQRVECGVRVLMVAAHPDDEDSALVAYLSHGRGARVTYLSLTRGEGGQNLIGTETGADLGVIRTSELLAARRIDGASQLFGRMIDFGFSKSPEECFAKWGRENIVTDIVRAIRLTRPHIVLSRFQGNAADGHGQHQAAAIAAREAIERAADPAAFPELAAEGLAPWAAQKFYVGAFRESPEVTLRIDTGEWDPWSGSALATLGYRGRSQHRSQDMGMLEYETAVRPSLWILEGGGGATGDTETDMFEGIEPPAAHTDRSPAVLLALPGALSSPEVMVPGLARLLGDRRAEQHEEIRDLEHALAALVGIRLEAFGDEPRLLRGSTATVRCRAVVPDGAPVSEPRWTLLAGEDFHITELRDTEADGGEEERGLRHAFQVAVPESAPLALPYYLDGGDDGHNGPLIHDWPDAPFAGAPFQPAPVRARFSALVAGERLDLEIPVEHRHADPSFGEIREDLEVVPAVSLSFGGGAESVTRSGLAESGGLTLNLDLRNLSAAPRTVRVSILAEENPAPVLTTDEIRLAAGGRRSHPVRIPAAALEGATTELSARITEIGEAGDSVAPAFDVRRIDYRHIRPRHLCRPARTTIRVLDVSVPAQLRIGYINGTGDDVAGSLRSLGVRVTEIGPDEITGISPERFDAVLLGVRAYETPDDLRASNSALFDYARRGGTLIVQYNKYDFANPGTAPYPVEFARPHDRVTDESAPMRLLAPDHPAFRFPNEIRERDFDGWVQERGLYFPSVWDERYTPLIECADPGEEPKRGGLLIAPLGEGRYIYTGLAFFRQLPAGAEGAARLLVNLLSLSLEPGAGAGAETTD